MAIVNLHETLLMYTKQKSMINAQLSGVMMNMLSASHSALETQTAYHEKLQGIYMDYQNGVLTEDEYKLIKSNYVEEQDYELLNLDSWESELELLKENLETRLNEITTYESSFQNELKKNLQHDFTYGQVKS